MRSQTYGNHCHAYDAAGNRTSRSRSISESYTISNFMRFDGQTLTIYHINRRGRVGDTTRFDAVSGNQNIDQQQHYLNDYSKVKSQICIRESY